MYHALAEVKYPAIPAQSKGHMTQPFVHLHNHMEGSYSDSALRVVDAVAQAAEWGMPALALTDHGDLAAAPRFIREATRRGVKPIVGVEFYFVPDAQDNIRRRINERFHLVLLAQNRGGFANLVRLVSASWRDNCLMQKLGLIDWTLLERHAEGLVCLSGCLVGPMAHCLVRDDAAGAEAYGRRLKEIFGDRFYVEVYEHHQPDEEKAARGLIEIASRLDCRVVLTNDCHYLRQEDWQLQDILLKTRFGKPTDFELARHEFYFKSAAEMRTLSFPPACSDATLEIAERLEAASPEWLVAAAPTGETQHVFLGQSRPIGRQRALTKVAGVLKLPRREQEALNRMAQEELRQKYPQVLELALKIEELPEAPQPVFGQVVSGADLTARVPVRRVENALQTMWTEEECRAAGAAFSPLAACPAPVIALAEATERYLQGLAEYRKRRLEKARDLFRRALESDVRFTNARYQLGLVEYYRDRVNEALDAFRRVLEEAPDFERLPHLLSYMGWCHFKLGEYEEAEMHFRRSLALKAIPGSQVGLGLALEKRGMPEEARAVLLKYLEASPDDAQVALAQEALDRIMAGSPRT